VHERRFERFAQVNPALVRILDTQERSLRVHPHITCTPARYDVCDSLVRVHPCTGTVCVRARTHSLCVGVHMLREYSDRNALRRYVHVHLRTHVGTRNNAVSDSQRRAMSDP